MTVDWVAVWAALAALWRGRRAVCRHGWFVPARRHRKGDCGLCPPETT